MGINTNNSIDASFLERWISVQTMMSILDVLSKDDLLYPNYLGNISIYRDGEYIGYIDIPDGVSAMVHKSGIFKEDS